MQWRSNLMRYYYVYIMTNKHRTTFYTGVTSNLISRVYQHEQEVALGFTRKYSLHDLVYFEVYEDVYEAIRREKQLKVGSRLKKLMLVMKSNPNFESLNAEIAASSSDSSQ